MNKQLMALVALLGLCVAGTALAEPRHLRGQVLLVQKDGQTRPASGAEVKLLGRGNPTRTDDEGSFKLFLPDSLRPGAPIRLSVELKGYLVWSPHEGRILVPQDLETQEQEVRMLPAGSRTFLSAENIEQLLRAAMDDSRNQVAEDGKRSQGKGLSRHIAEWAHQYGFSAQQVKAEVDKWIAEVEKNQDDESRLAVAAFARRDFQAAARHAGISAENKRQRLEAFTEKVEAEKQRLGDEVARDYKLQGRAYLEQVEHFDKSLQAYEKAVKYLSKQSDTLLWADTWSQLGLAHQVMAHSARWKGDTSREHLEAAVVAYRRAMEVPIREREPKLWVVTYVNLSNTLMSLSKSAEGKRRLELLKQAEEAARLGLQVDMKDIVPGITGVLQITLGNALLLQGMSDPEEAGVELLKQAVDAALLAVSTTTCNCLEEKDTDAQARARFLLGMAVLEWLPRGKPDTDTALALAKEAEKELRTALPAFTREKEPEHWATIHHLLGVASRLQAQYTQGAARLPLLSRAVEQSCQALSQHRRGTPEWNLAWTSLRQALSEQAKDASWMETESPANFELQARSQEAYLLADYFKADPLHVMMSMGHKTPRMQLGLRTVNIALFLAHDEPEYVPHELDALRAVVAAQPPDFKAPWDFSVLRCFIQNEERLDASRDWLRTLLQAVQARDRDTMFDGLYRARLSFRAH